jgi:type II secretory pathway component HofQ
MRSYFHVPQLFILCCGFAAFIYSSDIQGRVAVIDHFEVNNAKIGSVCKQLSAFSGIDIIVNEHVTGTVSLSVSKKTWREILDIICRINNLSVSNEGSYIYVLSSTELAKNATSVQSAQDLGPLKREIIRINHTPAGEIEKSIQTLLSSRGKVTVVTHTNALIIFDTQENINQIRQMISQLDVETAQISISCKIIEVSSGVIQRLGIHWGYADNQLEVEHLPKPSGGGGVVVDALDRITYGILNSQNLTAALEYLYGDNKGEIVAQPQITTVDNKEARIFMGQQVPVKYLDEAGNTVVKMLNAGTELIVKPHISGEGRILMELSPKKESYVRQADGTPIINQQSASTNVVVNNGETVVIAGLTSNEYSTAESGIPVLKDIPLLGNLFKRSEKNREKKDLIIFVTPYILNNRLTAAAAQVPDEITNE